MPQAVEAVVGKGESEKRLGGDLCGKGPGGKGSGDGLRLEVPAGERGDGVGGEEKVHAAREHRAGDTVQSRAIPGDLRLVDGQVGGNGAAQALLLQDNARFGLGEVLGRDRSGGYAGWWLVEPRDMCRWGSG